MTFANQEDIYAAMPAIVHVYYLLFLYSVCTTADTNTIREPNFNDNFTAGVKVN